MAPLPKKTIKHFTHPNHQLFELHNNNEYLCDGCKTLGIGTRFRCHDCDFDLHEYCSTCPGNLSSFMHSQHQLHLVLRQPQATPQNDRICDVCGDYVEGLLYRCKLCDFDVHPLCTQLPRHVRHFLHPLHPLTLQPFSSTWCAVCRKKCTSWRYRCGICCVDIHLECLSIVCDASTSTPRLVRQRSAPPAASPPPAYAHGFPSFGSNVQAPYFGPYPYGVPSGLGAIHQYPQGNQQQAGGRRFRKKMYKIVGSLALGVVTSAVSTALFGV
ncbi:Cysteine/Histidine-rich C1 domain family protein [Melia azedarach]|uniref:Cysteine/Histidine-rich C1 domain family protein n=1 Tax=Melia azedarach TaxID=155640 RepID=A0ACC1X1X4_MELAZ|nr:Cysteine/Histidine-rich C1 domain family protein [Melia azedarach]